MDRQYQKRKGKNNTLRRIIVTILIVLVAILVPSFFIFTGAKSASNHAKWLIAGYKEQNFDQIKGEVKELKNSLRQVDWALTSLFWMRIIPIVGGYYSDAKGLASATVDGMEAADTIIANLEPVKAELGFDGRPKAGPDRMTQTVKILDKSLPILDKVEDNFKKAAEAVSNIDTGKYPESIGGKVVRKNLELAKNFIMGASVAVSEGREALAKAPDALGVDSTKEYLILFQNDKEIRPTGGFMTAFATLTVNKGQVSATTSDDIYRLDEKLLDVCLTKICPLSPPAPIVKYLPEVTGKERSAWSMRDSNISPNLPTAAEEFERMYELLGEGLPFDGIIYIDSQVVEEVIEVTGPIDVFETKYSSEIDKRCNCPNVIYELESYAEIAAKGEKDRKAILGVLMQQILAKALGADVERLPELVATIARLANHKHIMFYMHDQNFQNALGQLNWIGEIKEYDGDYLHINDANFAGGKTNLYVTQEVTQEIKIEKGKVIKKITINYENPQPFNSWLNTINRDYIRFYVPKGSKLLSGTGADEEVRQIEDDLGKSVFETFITVRPKNSRTLRIEYEVPYDPKGEYKLLIQKQPGAKDFKYKIKINASQKAEFELDQDQEFKFDL
ncbi:DUF4012 domain-containing protein [Candidatus Daviesbacteria bacterium]|nr:DUF4012 domain-containing protein [Candidatus Daviesbacteria bacterium]